MDEDEASDDDLVTREYAGGDDATFAEGLLKKLALAEYADSEAAAAAAERTTELA